MKSFRDKTFLRITNKDLFDKIEHGFHELNTKHDKIITIVNNYGERIALIEQKTNSHATIFKSILGGIVTLVITFVSYFTIRK